MIRLGWLALVALGLWASLAPQVTYPSASSGEPSGQVMVAWPGWAIQQDLGTLSGTIGPFQIWVSAEPDRGIATVWASLVDASTNAVLRQATIEVTPAYVPVARTLTFPGYVAAEGQRLQLQLQVAMFEERYVIYGLAHPELGKMNVALNGVPDAGRGPLAFAHVQTGSGLRAAIVGESSGRIRLALAVAFSALAILAHPRALAQLRRLRATARSLARWPITWVRRLADAGAEPDTGDQSTKISRLFSSPWYPWPVAAIPILHFLTSNPQHFAAREAAIPLGVALMVVTGSVVGLRLVLKDWHRPAAATAIVTVIFFAYGHVSRALYDRVDERVLFAAAVVLGVAAIARMMQTGRLATRSTQLMNLAAAILLAFSIANLAGQMAASFGRSSEVESVAVEDLAAHLFPRGLPTPSDQRPDIYYVILDAYARHDALGDFDNTDFLNELERRGFYIASEATSNYRVSIQSITSSLNMAYLDDLGHRTPTNYEDLLQANRYSALVAILKNLGYTYVHLESGFPFSNKAPLADISFTFAPAGVQIGSNENEFNDKILSAKFLRELMETTALRPIVGDRFLLGADAPYSWWSPYRAIQMFDVLTNPIETAGPKFVFAHIVKPHRPATFDRHGNYVSGDTLHGSEVVRHDEFDGFHDPSVADAYLGQVIYINSLVLKMIDGIVRSHDDPPIIVIAADHGRDGAFPQYAILAAFHLPNGGNQGLYESISSVNHFRYIMDFYFGVNLGLIEDQEIDHERGQYNFIINTKE